MRARGIPSGSTCWAESRRLATLELTKAPLVLVGHSHVPFAVALDGDELSGAHAPAGTEIGLTPGRWLCNPGSVGQPRDGDWRAAWLLVELAERHASFRREEYDMKATQAEIREAGLPASLAERLALRGLDARRSAGRDVHFRLARRAVRDALTCERQLNLVPRLVDAPLHGGERDLESVRDLGVRQADDVAEQQRHLEIRIELVDCSPERVDRLQLLDRSVEHL